ncbi:ParA family protein [Acetobacterium carbinolicum]|uniref:ParA family protein n=1 Tax=Acetobacterium carbinolicum TaxID=52690 RepID=UPI0039C94F67
MEKKCTTIAIVNQKGGVGKTTSTYNLGWELGKLGKKVLLVDLDSQGNLTMQSGVPRPDELKMTISTLMTKSIYDEELPAKEEVILHKDMVDILPSNIELSNVEIQLVNATMREFVLKGILDEYKTDYDYVLIDCMPSLLMLPINALAAADMVVIPVAPEFWAVKGIEALFNTIKTVKKKHINRKLVIGGILITKYTPKLKSTKEMENIIMDVFGERIHVYESKIPSLSKVADAGKLSLSVRELYDKFTIKREKESIIKAVEAYESLAKELVEN